MVQLVRKLSGRRKVTLSDVASSKPSRAADKAVTNAFIRASKKQAAISKKAADIRAR